MVKRDDTDTEMLVHALRDVRDWLAGKLDVHEGEEKRHAIMYRPQHEREHWKRTVEQAMELGAAINSAKLAV